MPPETRELLGEKRRCGLTKIISCNTPDFHQGAADADLGGTFSAATCEGLGVHKRAAENGAPCRTQTLALGPVKDRAALHAQAGEVLLQQETVHF